MRRYEKRVLDEERGDVQSFAASQSARIASWQLRAMQVPLGRSRGWTRNGWLIPVAPRVFAVGTRAESDRADLWAAVLYAGPGAMLSHASAGHHRGLLRYPPRDGVHVSTPRRVASVPGIVVHARRDLPRDTFDGLPVTDPVQTMVDLASVQSLRATRRALAQLDFEQTLDLDALWRATRRPRPGTERLREAIVQHNPQYARLNEGLETGLFELLESARFDPLPEVNVELEPGLTVDFYFRASGVVVETDGDRNHSSAEQRLQDARRDLRCRRRGLLVIRYRHAQIHHEPGLVLFDLRTELNARASWRSDAWTGHGPHPPLLDSPADADHQPAHQEGP